MIVPKAKKLPSGNWFINLRLGGQNIPITESTERRCVQQAQMIKAEYLAGKRSASVRSARTLTQAVDRFVEINQNILSPSTLRGYRAVQKNRFPELMNLPVSKITRETAQRAVNNARKQYSAKTIKNSWFFISQIIFDETGNRIDVTLPQVVQKEVLFLDPDQIKIFTEAVAGQLCEIPALLALCSLRQSEILALRWSDIDLDNATVTISGAMVPDEHHQYQRKSETKNRSSRRVVPIMPQLVEALKAAPHTSDRVVMLSHSGIYKGINRVCRNNGLPEVGVHGLRHSFASLAYSLGMSEKITMEIGGWSDDATMKKIYTHVARADRLKAETAMKTFYTRLDADQSKD